MGWDWDAIKKKDAQPQKQGRKSAFGPNDFHWDKAIPDGPLAHGFDHYFGDTVINFPPYCWIEDEHVTQAPDVMMDSNKWKKIKEGNWECRPGPMVSGWDPYQVMPTLSKKASQYIHKQKREQATFLFYTLPSLHPMLPLFPTINLMGNQKQALMVIFVVETDHVCGELIKALKDSGQYENTIIIFTADNGPEHYAYARDEKYGHWSAHPFRGLKRGHL